MPEHHEDSHKKKLELTDEEQLLLRAYAEYRNRTKVPEHVQPDRIEPPVPKRICIESVAKSLQSQSEKKPVQLKRHRPRKTWGAALASTDSANFNNQ